MLIMNRAGSPPRGERRFERTVTEGGQKPTGRANARPMITPGAHRDLDWNDGHGARSAFATPRLHRPLRPRPSRAPKRPPQPIPTSVTFAKRPSEWNGMRGL